jgi:putative membrane protein
MRSRCTGLAAVTALGLAVQIAALAANLSPQDQKFVKEAAQGGLAEVMLGQMAAMKTEEDAVKQFGQMMVKDHTKANKQLKEITTEKGVRLPAEVAPEHKALAARLEKLSGAEFDRAYMKEMIEDHEKDVKEFQKEADSGRDADIKKWAAKTLPTLQMHLKMAKETAARLSQ